MVCRLGGDESEDIAFFYGSVSALPSVDDAAFVAVEDGVVGHTAVAYHKEDIVATDQDRNLVCLAVLQLPLDLIA